MNFHLWNAIFENNFSRHDVLGVFDVQIEFPRIFDKFSKITLMEMAMGGRSVTTDNDWRQMVLGDDSGILIFFIMVNILFP